MKGNPIGGLLFNHGWLPKPANSELPLKGRSLRETWSSKADEFNQAEGGRATTNSHELTRISRLVDSVSGRPGGWIWCGRRGCFGGGRG